MDRRKCIYCGTAEDLSDSDIIPDALTAARIINKCVCHVEHNSGMTEKFEAEVAKKLAFLLNYLNTPVYNFINDRLVDESAVLRPLSWHLILYVFR
ncbi:MAG: hypothetical protein E6109_17760, partial [Ruminococcus sp.]|nr:hypothetical protein [Ruminococcus sp.]